MSLDVYLTATRPTTVFDYNITHNLGKMADVVGLYKPLWRPEEIGITKARELIDPLRVGLQRLQDERTACEAVAPDNGWGTYAGLVKFVTEYLAACEESPDADVSVSR